MLTGVFYHESFSRRSYLTLGNRLRDFPQAFERFEGNRNFKLFESPEVSEELLKLVHSGEMIEAVKREPLCSTAWRSAGGVVKATEMVFDGELRNAFCYIGAGGHHAGRDYFWGYCCFNDVVLAIRNVLERREARFAIIDTDAHHGDGTRQLVAELDVLHYCICDRNFASGDGLKIDVSYLENDYFEAVEEFCDLCRSYEPDLIFWYFGHDTHVGDYGDIGMTVSDYRRIAEMVKNLAEDVCSGKLVVVLGGGSDPDIARESTLAIIDVLLS